MPIAPIPPRKPDPKRVKAHLFGLRSEQIARALLRLKGYEIIDERYKNAFGEIDILAKKGDVLALVEVKARKRFQDCAEAITPAKQQRQIKAAKSLLAYPGKHARHINANTQLRFDVIMVVPWHLPHHITNAFIDQG